MTTISVPREDFRDIVARVHARDITASDMWSAAKCYGQNAEHYPKPTVSSPGIRGTWCRFVLGDPIRHTDGCLCVGDDPRVICPHGHPTFFWRYFRRVFVR